MMDFCLRCILCLVVALCSLALAGGSAGAGQPRLDADTCKQLHTEQATFIQSGILSDLQKGAVWGRNNLSADRLREIEHYIMLDEQIKFACREATLTPELERAGEIAKRLEANPNADPFAPLPEPGAEGATDGDDNDRADSPPPKTKAKPSSTAAAASPAPVDRPVAKDKPAKKIKAERAKPDDALKSDALKPDAPKSDGPKSGWTNPDTGVRTVPLTTEPIR